VTREESSLRKLMKRLRIPGWRESLAASNSGNIPKWLGALERLPEANADEIVLDSDAPAAVSSEPLSAETARRLENALMELHPWRKGPFDLFGIEIDAEWRSNIKWRRLAPHLGRLDGKTVLDIGCGNGYYALRALGAGADALLGVDTSPLHVIQFQALAKYLRAESAEIILMDCGDLPREQVFDTVLSMGVIYHRPAPEEHARLLFDMTAPGGTCVLESLVVDGDENSSLIPTGRYAQMRNVHQIPSPALLKRWMESAGFADAKILDVSGTTHEEQRRTKWMTFHSLKDFLSSDMSRTLEGHPPPKRAIVLARKPAIQPYP